MHRLGTLVKLVDFRIYIEKIKKYYLQTKNMSGKREEYDQNFR